jgi:RNA polymerase sigma-70 factor (ECF subfamily)
MQTERPPEAEALDAARSGDEDAYARLIEPYRPELLAHCYRMLASLPDAEDALQEALLRAWRGLPRFEGRSSLRSWLYRIATNVCLKAIERRPKRMLPSDYGPSAATRSLPVAPPFESGWIDPFPDEASGVEDGRASPEARYERRESIELAFTAALQHLPARQRAVLILRDVIGLSAGEVAEALDSTPASIYSALQRAHASVAERLPARSQQTTLRALGDVRLRALVESHVDAWERGDVASLVSLLTDDVTLAMPPSPTWFRGRDVVSAFLADHPFAARNSWRLLPIRASGQLAFAAYLRASGRDVYTAHAIEVLTVRGDRISAIDSFMSAEGFSSFGLPLALEGRAMDS